MRKKLFLIGWVSLSMVMVSISWSFGAGVSAPINRPALKVKNPAQSLLLGIASAADRLVAVGERGVVVLSDDGGQTWRQAKNVPTSVTLTAVKFSTPAKGWAVGHAGVILYTKDGGENWVQQLDGKAAADIAYQAAQDAEKMATDVPENIQQLIQSTKLLVTDGPDKPFLDLYIENERSCFVIGAYGLIFRTTDGGQTWQSWMNFVDNPDGLHLYDIVAVGQSIFITGEQGLFLRSMDETRQFERIETPYEGSYFVITANSKRGIVLAGLRGNAYRSIDQGNTFEKVLVPMPTSFSAAALLPDGRMIFSNQAGFLLESRDNGKTMKVMETERLAPLAAIVALGPERIVAVGSNGAACVPFPKTGDR